MKREFAEMQNIVGLSGLLPREDDSLKGERNLEAMMNRQEKKLRRKRVLQIVRYTTSAAAMIALTWMLAWYMLVGSETPSYTEITVPKGQRVHLTLPDKKRARPFYSTPGLHYLCKKINKYTQKQVCF